MFPETKVLFYAFLKYRLFVHRLAIYRLAIYRLAVYRPAIYRPAIYRPQYTGSDRGILETVEVNDFHDSEEASNRNASRRCINSFLSVYLPESHGN